MKHKTGFLESLSDEEERGMRRALDLDTVVVDAPGRYRTRANLVAVVRKTSLPMPYSCAGYVCLPDGTRKTGVTWAHSGRYRASGIHEHDIVSKA